MENKNIETKSQSFFESRGWKLFSSIVSLLAAINALYVSFENVRLKRELAEMKRIAELEEEK